MGDALAQMLVLAIGDIMEQHALYVSYSSNVSECQGI